MNGEIAQSVQNALDDQVKALISRRVAELTQSATYLKTVALESLLEINNFKADHLAQKGAMVDLLPSEAYELGESLACAELLTRLIAERRANGR